MFELVSDFQPAGDQPQAIESLVEQVEGGVVVDLHAELGQYFPRLAEDAFDQGIVQESQSGSHGTFLSGYIRGWGIFRRPE